MNHCLERFHAGKLSLPLVGCWLVCFFFVTGVAAVYSPALILFPLIFVYLVAFSNVSCWTGAGVLVLMPLAVSGYFNASSGLPWVVIVRAGIMAFSLFSILKFIKPLDIPRVSIVSFLLFVAYVAVATPFASGYVSISYMKLFFWSTFVYGLLCSTSNPCVRYDFLIGWFCFIVSGSILAYFVKPEIGYAFTYTGAVSDGIFSGVMKHPQLLAGLLAISTPLLLWCWVFFDGVRRCLIFAIGCGVLYLLFTSSSRTGVASTLFSLGLSTILMYVYSSDVKIRRRVISIWVVALVVIVFVMGLSFDKASQFVVKKSDVGEVSLSGRDQIVMNSWDAFCAKPILGNGFQVPSSFTEHAIEGFELGESTSIEKSFLFSMILEECGIVASFLFILFYFSLVLHGIRVRAVVFSSMLATFLIINIGEAVMFSPSGLGGLCWILCFSTFKIRL